MKVNGAALAAIRAKDGITQLRLAEISGVSQGRISELEDGTLNVRPATVKALATALCVPMSSILVNPDEAVA